MKTILIDGHQKENQGGSQAFTRGHSLVVFQGVQGLLFGATILCFFLKTIRYWHFANPRNSSYVPGSGRSKRYRRQRCEVPAAREAAITANDLPSISVI